MLNNIKRITKMIYLPHVPIVIYYHVNWHSRFDFFIVFLLYLLLRPVCKGINISYFSSLGKPCSEMFICFAITN